jgi:single stranded DNA-binding protein
MNNWVLSGNLVKDIKFSETEKGDIQAIFDIGVKDGYTDSDGEWVGKSSFFKVKCWKKPAESLKKAKVAGGNGIVCIGKCAVRKWEDEEGNRKTDYYMHMERWEFPTSPGNKKKNKDDEEDETRPKKEIDLDDDDKPKKVKKPAEDYEEYENNEGMGASDVEVKQPSKKPAKKEDDEISPEDMALLNGMDDD